jgi:hypothetical protein
VQRIQDSRSPRILSESGPFVKEDTCPWIGEVWKTDYPREWECSCESSQFFEVLNNREILVVDRLGYVALVHKVQRLGTPEELRHCLRTVQIPQSYEG